ncbi:MAG: phosphoribosylglycinamide formyltransferase [Neisseriaceae bacterium]|nr:phosphoribosylglycinamide formyltransferase [Neisseriaceae bacterium]
MKKKIVILISGRGSNMQAIVEANIPNAEICAIVSNDAQAEGIAWAKARGLATHGLDHKEFPSREAFDQALIKVIDFYRPDLVVLAGFMRILTTPFCLRYEGRMINIHPSLLPSFPGLYTHQKALDLGCKVAGATVHFVTPQLDHGPIIAQAVVPVLSGDTADDLGKRILAIEHQIFPKAVAGIIAGNIRLDDKRVCVINDAAPTDANSQLISF